MVIILKPAIVWALCLSVVSISTSTSAFAFASTSASASFTVLKQRDQRLNGYDCGSVVYTDQMVREAFNQYKLNNGQVTPIPYVGPLYSTSLKYFTWPIHPHWSFESTDNGNPRNTLWHKARHQIVFDIEGRIIDVLVRMANFDFTRCPRVYPSQPENSMDEVEDSNGYQCGHQFFDDKILQESALLAVPHIGKDHLYPAPYKGRLYDENLGYMMWPIYRAHRPYRNPSLTGGPYFVVIEPSGQLKDVIVRTAGHEYVQCLRSRKFPPAPISDPQSSFFAQPSKSGYICNKIFFKDSDLQAAAQKAMITTMTNNRKIYPLKYEGTAFDSPCLFWPLGTDGKSHLTGRFGQYRLVLTYGYQIMGVVMESHDAVKKCERKTIPGGRHEHVKHNFNCDDELFLHTELVSVAKIACQKMAVKGLVFPARYEGHDFEIEGPYFIFPLLKHKKKSFTTPGRHRLVMTYNCKVAGALTMNRFTNQFDKCKISASNHG